jgi:hypothetical protein
MVTNLQKMVFYLLSVKNVSYRLQHTIQLHLRVTWKVFDLEKRNQWMCDHMRRIKTGIQVEFEYWSEIMSEWNTILEYKL